MSNENKEGYVYILRLQGGKWYVGWTKDIEKRLRKHLSTKSSKTKVAWLKTYAAIECVWVTKGTTAVEKVVAIEMLRLHGATNVRGGSYIVSTNPYYKQEYIPEGKNIFIVEKFFSIFS